MQSKVDNVLGMNLHAMDDSDEIIVGNDGLANPYMHYPGANASDPSGDADAKPKGSKKKSAAGGAVSGNGNSATTTGSASRPKSAARRSGRDEK